MRTVEQTIAAWELRSRDLIVPTDGGPGGQVVSSPRIQGADPEVSVELAGPGRVHFAATATVTVVRSN